jgi:predicted nucleotide-binding protein
MKRGTETPMQQIIERLSRLADAVSQATEPLATEDSASSLQALLNSATTVGKAWSNSWFGYHARVYKADLKPRGPGDYFDVEWGFYQAISNKTQGNWGEFDRDGVVEHICDQAHAAIPLEQLWVLARSVGKGFDAAKDELIPLLAALGLEDEFVSAIKMKVEDVRSHDSGTDFVRYRIGKQAVVSRDMRAINEGVQTPPHVSIEAQVFEIQSYKANADVLRKCIQQLARYLSDKARLREANVAMEQCIFIGHGHSLVWRELKDFISDRLHLKWVEFESEATAGTTTVERLSEMLRQSTFAFLVMTSEDVHADGSEHARENVVHEAGLFQGRLGFRRAIVLLEDSCAEFSNIAGLGQIRFPKSKVSAKFEEVRRVLEREGIL